MKARVTVWKEPEPAPRHGWFAKIIGLLLSGILIWIGCAILLNQYRHQAIATVLFVFVWLLILLLRWGWRTRA
jgi:hypothetical protein